MNKASAHSLAMFYLLFDKYVQFRNDTPECRLQSSWLLDSTYGSIHTLNAPESAAAADFEIPPCSMSSRALTRAISPAWVGSAVLSLTVMKPFLV
jgi:hypothetical protein